MGVRFSYHGSKGYALIVADGEDTESGHRRYVFAHRLAAYAWGELDALHQPLEIDHLDRSRTHNSEDNLCARAPREHGKITRERERDAATEATA